MSTTFTLADLHARIYGRCQLRGLADLSVQALTPRGPAAPLASCTECEDQCYIHANEGLAGEHLDLSLRRHPYSGEQLVWPCPGCGHEVTEERAPFTRLFAQVDEIEADPLCHSCRSK